MNNSDIKEILEYSYNIKISRMSMQRDRFVFDCGDSKPYELVERQISQQRLLFTYVAQSYLVQNGFILTNAYLPARNKYPYISINDSLYTVAPSIQGKECNPEKDEDCVYAALALAKMHIAGQGFTQEYALRRLLEIQELPQKQSASSIKGYIKNDLFTALPVLNKRTNELSRFAKMARRGRSRFDYAYAAIAEYYCQSASDICVRLEMSGYKQICQEYEKKGCVCHKEYTSHNIVNTYDGTHVLNFEDCRIDIPLCDITTLLKRRMRACGAKASDAQFIIDSYNSIRPISKEEKEVIKIILGFPQKLWRIVNKYYNSNRTWSEKNCLIKLDEIVNERESLEIFMREL